MTRGFSIGEALNAPFVLLRRRPLSLFVWGFVRLIVFGAMAAVMAPFIQNMPVGPMSEGDFPASMQYIAQFEAGLQALNLLQILTGLIVWTAAMRATLATRGDGFAFMRLGMDEVRVAVVVLVTIIGFYLGLIIAVLLGVGLGFAVWSLGQPWNVLILIGYGVLILIGLIWAYARLILIVPASLILKEFAFDEGWSLGKGQAFKIALTGVLSWLILMLTEIVFVAVMVCVIVGVGVAMGLTWPDFSTIETPQDLVAVLQPLAIPALILMLPASLFLGFAHAVFAAPLASVAQQLMGEPGSAPPTPDKKRTGRKGSNRPVRAPFPDLGPDPVPDPVMSAAPATENAEPPLAAPVVAAVAVAATAAHAAEDHSPLVADHGETPPAAEAADVHAEPHPEETSAPVAPASHSIDESHSSHAGPAHDHEAGASHESGPPADPAPDPAHGAASALHEGHAADLPDDSAEAHDTHPPAPDQDAPKDGHGH